MRSRNLAPTHQRARTVRPPHHKGTTVLTVPDIFTDEEKAKLKDPEYYRGFRDMIERDLGSVHGVTHQVCSVTMTVGL